MVNNESEESGAAGCAWRATQKPAHSFDSGKDAPVQVRCETLRVRFKRSSLPAG